MKERILLLTKNYPPQIGGIEKYSFDLYNSLVKEGNTVFLIAASPRNEWLLARKGTGKGIASNFWKILYVVSELWRLGIFAIKCFTLGFFYAFRSDLIWSLDGSIGWIGSSLGSYMGKTTRVSCLGRDVVWNFGFYQKLLKHGLIHTQEIYAFSESIKIIIENIGIIPDKITIDPYTQYKSIDLVQSGHFDRDRFLASYGIPVDKILLFSIGRFVEKKGFHWFLAEVFPFLDAGKFHYVLTGNGKLESLYKSIIAQVGLTNITLTGPIIDSLEKARLYSSMNYFVMPNISVQGDCEGYGLVLLEAQYYNLPIIASDIDGIGERVGENDIVLQSSHSQKWIKYMNKIQ